MLYGLDYSEYRVTKVSGVFDYFFRLVDSALISVAIATGGVLEVKDPATGNAKNVAYKFVVIVGNPSGYTVEALIGNKPHKAEAGANAVYVYLSDIHLKSTPIRIL